MTIKMLMLYCCRTVLCLAWSCVENTKGNTVKLTFTLKDTLLNICLKGYIPSTSFDDLSVDSADRT